MSVSFGLTDNYQIPFHLQGSDLDETQVFRPAAEITDAELLKRAQDLTQLSRDVYSTPTLTQDGRPKLDVPLQSVYTSLRDALFTQVTSFADALASPTNVALAATGSGSAPNITKYYAIVAEDATKRSEVSAEAYLTYLTGQTPVLTFSPTGAATKHHLYRGDYSGVYREEIQVTMSLAVLAAPSLTPAASGGSLASAVYYYMITALDAAGVETPMGVEANTAVTGPNGKVTLSWTARTGASTYRIYRGTATNAQNVYYTSGTNSYVDTGAAATSGTPTASARLSGGSFGSVGAPILSAIGTTSSTTLKVQTTVGYAADDIVLLVDTYSYARPLVTGLSSSGTGGSLTVGVHSVRVTAADAYRESVASPLVSVTVASGEKITVSWSPVRDATTYHVYRTAPDGTEYRVVTTTGTLGNGVLSYLDDGAATEATASPQVAYYKQTTTIVSVDAVNKILVVNDAVPTHLYRGYTLVFGERAATALLTPHESTHLPGGSDVIPAEGLTPQIARRAENLGADPSASAGRLWYNTATGLLKYSTASTVRIVEYQANKNVASGYAGLDGSALLSSAVIPFGSSSGTVTEGNDSRLSNARTPTAHAASHAGAGSDPLTSLGAITLTGLLTTLASATGGAGFNLPSGTAPTSPVNGDVWYDGTNILARLAGTSRTFVSTNATQTLSAKTLTSPTVNDPVLTLQSTVGVTTARRFVYDGGLLKYGDGTNIRTLEITSNKGAASGYASLDSNTLVVQNPANATATPTASKIPIADGGGKLDSWITTATSGALGLIKLTTDLGNTAAAPQVIGLGGDALPSTVAHGFLKRNSGNTGWEEVAYGTGSNTVAQGNDARLSDARTPTAHATSHHSGGSDALTLSSIAGTLAAGQIAARGITQDKLAADVFLMSEVFGNTG